MMKPYIIAISVVIGIGVICFIISDIRNNITYNNHLKILNAIYLYNISSIGEKNKVSVTYEDMEPYDTTYNRIWDLGCTRILPPEKFEVIKPFIK